MPFLPHSTDYAFDDLPVTVLNGWQVGSICGQATLHYDASGYWRIVAMLTTDRYRERSRIDDHVAEQLADMQSSVVANRADRAYRLRAESLPSDAGVR